MTTCQIINGDALTELRKLPVESVQCVVTSPPYWGLRDYGVKGQIGLEPTPDAYVTKLVEVFREVRRVLRPDGTLWLNIADSMSGGKGANAVDCLNRILKGAPIAFLNSVAVAVSSHSVDVAADYQGSPQSVFLSLLTSEWDTVKDWHENFGEVLHLLASPSDAGIGTLVLRQSVNGSDVQVIAHHADHVGVIDAELDSQSKPELGVLRPVGAGTGEDDKAALSVNQSDEPCAHNVIVWHSAWDTFMLNALGKGFPDVDMVNEPIAFRDGFHTLACTLRDFRITQASVEKVTLRSVGGGFEFRVSDVGHLWFSLSDGSIVPYSRLYREAIQMSNRERPKQELAIPERVKIALQEDGWICRSTVIWSKPNCMPESVKDRCTRSHEYIFLLSKSANYFYDADAIKEPAIYADDNRKARAQEGHKSMPTRERNGIRPVFKDARTFAGKHSDKQRGHSRRHDGFNDRWDAMSKEEQCSGMRNKRDVWTICPAQYSEAHFATFPPEIPRLCILAGSRAGDTVLDPFAGSGTTGEVAQELGRKVILIELNPAYCKLASRRTAQTGIVLSDPGSPT